MAQRRLSQHPGLHAVMAKAHRRERLSESEIQLLQRQLEHLERRDAVAEEAASAADPGVDAPSEHRASPGFATLLGGEQLAHRSGVPRAAFTRPVRDISMSSVGIGTYRGARDDSTDGAYAMAVHAALRGGVNLIDTSLNYRHQRSERSVAAGLRLFFEDSGGSRDEVVVCTKGGYLVPAAFDGRGLEPGDVVGRSHCMAPAFLADQIERSHRNLGLETIDVYYLHNPETQLKFIRMPEFLVRIRSAFEFLEQAVADGKIRYYGTATWDGYRHGIMSLPEIAGVAERVAGADHHFRFVQLPFSLGMEEAFTPGTADGPHVLEIAEELGVSVIASASLLQARLAQDLPARVAELVPGLDSDAQRAIQFARCAPGIASALVGMRSKSHVEEALAVVRAPRLTTTEHRRVRAAIS